MTAEGAEGIDVTALTEFLGTPPPDDAGARTADLFDWQAAVAAADGLVCAVLRSQDREATGDSPPYMIICEHHEDYAVLRGDKVELVSAKHRELSSGAWTWATLTEDGGLAHLFARWRALGRGCRCRMVTNAGLSAGRPTHLKSACEALRGGSLSDRGDAKLNGIFREFGIELVRHADKASLPPEWRAEVGTPKENISPTDALLDCVREFLGILCLDTGRPHRDNIGPAAPEMYAEPLLVQLQIPVTYSRAAWLAVLDVFRQRMRARGPVLLGGLAPLVAAAREETAERALARELRARRVSAEDVVLAVGMAVAAPGAYTSLDISPAATRLAVKLVDGGCTPTTVRTAEALAAHWRSARHERVADVPGVAVDFAMAELRLRQLASTAAETASAVSEGGKYGSTMWQELNRTVTTEALAGLPLQADALLAMGGVCDLASRCDVWFGSEFDVAAAQAQARARAGRSSIEAFTTVRS